MNACKNVLLTLGFTFLILPLMNVSAESSYYPLYCKTSASIGILNTYLPVLSPGSAKPRNWLRLHYKKSSRAATNRGATLQAGECAWADRPLSQNESSCMEYYHENGLHYVLPKNIAFNSDGNISAKNNAILKTELALLSTMNQSEGKLFMVKARSQGKDECLQIKNTKTMPEMAYCLEGSFDGTNCVAKYFHQMGLKANKSVYWYDPNHGSIYKKAAGKRCDEGRFDGVNCKIKTYIQLGLKGPSRAYWYDKRFGHLYRKPNL